MGAIACLNFANVLPAKAEARQINLTLTSSSNSTFTSLVQQAESLAHGTIEQIFVAYPSVTEVSVMILGDRNGQEVPLLVSKVSRSDWQRDPSIRTRTQYFSSSELLLGFLKLQVRQAALPGPTPQPANTQLEDPGFRDD